MKRLFLGLALVAITAFGADVAGTWKGALETQNGTLEIEYQFKAEDGKLTGTASSHMGSIAITDGKVDGDNITFTIATGEYTVVHKGTVSGDEMKLTADVGSRTLEITAKRVPPPA
ncbi:MAG: hypothetical protein KIT83_12200 [Bryobacterales bacterium]|nr:hypothetical protein [Bryobacterales bacterium]